MKIYSFVSFLDMTLWSRSLWGNSVNYLIRHKTGRLARQITLISSTDGKTFYVGGKKPQSTKEENEICAFCAARICQSRNDLFDHKMYSIRVQRVYMQNIQSSTNSLRNWNKLIHRGWKLPPTGFQTRNHKNVFKSIGFQTTNLKSELNLNEKKTPQISFLPTFNKV